MSSTGDDISNATVSPTSSGTTAENVNHTFASVPSNTTVTTSSASVTNKTGTTPSATQPSFHMTTPASAAGLALEALSFPVLKSGNTSHGSMEVNTAGTPSRTAPPVGRLSLEGASGANRELAVDTAPRRIYTCKKCTYPKKTHCVCDRKHRNRRSNVTARQRFPQLEEPGQFNGNSGGTVTTSLPPKADILAHLQSPVARQLITPLTALVEVIRQPSSQYNDWEGDDAALDTDDENFQQKRRRVEAEDNKYILDVKKRTQAFRQLSDSIYYKASKLESQTGACIAIAIVPADRAKKTSLYLSEGLDELDREVHATDSLEKLFRLHYEKQTNECASLLREIIQCHVDIASRDQLLQERDSEIGQLKARIKKLESDSATGCC